MAWCLLQAKPLLSPTLLGSRHAWYWTISVMARRCTWGVVCKHFPCVLVQRQDHSFELSPPLGHGLAVWSVFFLCRQFGGRACSHLSRIVCGRPAGRITTTPHLLAMCHVLLGGGITSAGAVDREFIYLENLRELSQTSP